MEPFRDDSDLAATLSALRPTPRPAFAAELDERAAAGFPRRSSSATAPLVGFIAKLQSMRPRSMLLPASGVALTAIVAATVVVAIGEPGSQSRPSRPSHGPVQFEGDATTITGPTTPSGKASSGVPGLAGGTSDGSAAGEAAEELVPAGSGPYASGSPHRDIEQSAEMALGADPADVGDDATKVFDAVHANNGIVLSSSIEDGPAGDAGAEFELLIPSAKLGDALAAFSAIDEVLSRHQATADITAPTVNLGERLQDSRAKVEGLLEQLANADTDTERAAAEAQLRAERRHAAALRSQLSALQRRANLARVSLRIETGDASSSSDSGDNGWGVGDALDDAGHILGIAAGVAIVGLAILAPLALIALLIWLANAARLRRRRERALD